ncbi:hypothetical protein V6N13_002924 [Hibiscus sabdariffa]
MTETQQFSVVYNQVKWALTSGILGLALLQKALEDALNLLLHVKALEKTSLGGRYEPTFYGRLLASFSLSFDASVLVVKFGEAGMLREGILLGIFMDTQPLPILHPFGMSICIFLLQFAEYINCFFCGDSDKIVLTGRKEDKHRLEHLKRVLEFEEMEPATLLLPKLEEEWCSFHHLLQSSLHHGCRNGDLCSFSHDSYHSASSNGSIVCLPEVDHADASSLLQLVATSSDDGYILLLDDASMHFTSNLSNYCKPSRIISTTSLTETSICDPLLTDVRILWGLHHPYQTIISNPGENQIPWNEVKFVLWLPYLDGHSENLDAQKFLVQNFFEYLAIRILGDALFEIKIILSMNNIKFSQLEVEKLARESFFFLTEPFPFDEASLGELLDTVTVNKPMVTSRLLASFSLSFDASVLVVKFGEAGMLREGILLGIFMDTQSLPILHPFGDEHLFTEYINCFFCGDSGQNCPNWLRFHPSGLVLNLCCKCSPFLKDKHRLEHLKRVLEFEEMEPATFLLPKLEEEWCSFHHLLQSLLHHSAIVQVDAAPFKQWYLQHYGVDIGRKKKTTATKKDGEEGETGTEETKKSNHVLRKLEKRQQDRKLDPHIEDQFTRGRLLACITSWPGQCGRCDGVILEGKELEFYMEKIQKKGKGAA